MGSVEVRTLSKADFPTLVEGLPAWAERLAATVQSRLAQRKAHVGLDATVGVRPGG